MFQALKTLDDEEWEKWLEFLKKGDTAGYATILLEITHMVDLK